MSTETERTVKIKDKSLYDVRDFLKNQQRQLEEKCSPVMLVGPLHGSTGGIDWLLKYVPEKTRQTTRKPTELRPGMVVVEEMPDGDGVSITFKVGHFPYHDLFWQKMDELQSGVGCEEPIPLPGFPKTKKGRELWAKAYYEGIVPLRDEYCQRRREQMMVGMPEDDLTPAEPDWREYSERILSVVRRAYKRRSVERIRDAGDARKLKEYYRA